MAIVEIREGRGQAWPSSLPPTVAWVNMAGSIAFGISAIAACIDPTNGELLNVAAANAFTFLGAALFFVGAVLLLPDLGRAEVSPEVS